ncbi:UNVERIFIED_CONTAM: hypothetical protein Cloal_3518 [Acetivibrio alkalicellulosi]
MLKIDFGCGLKPEPGYKTCDITTYPYLDYWYDPVSHTITDLKPLSIDELRCRNVLHHIYDLEDSIIALDRYIKPEGIIRVIEPRKEYFDINVMLDTIYYHGVCNMKDMWFSKSYREYIHIFENIGYQILKRRDIENKTTANRHEEIIFKKG